MADPLPESFPPMGAEFKKPYMEFEYDGQIYKMTDLQGGHNGSVAEGCIAHPPEYDPEKGRWVVKVQNNLIDIDLGAHPAMEALFSEKTKFLSKARIFSNPRRSFASIGYLLTTNTSPQDKPTFPIDCVFLMHIRISVPGKPSLINVKPFELTAKNLTTWPPPVGTVYEHNDTVELYPEWIPFGHVFMKPIVKIPPGDKTILTKVFELPQGPKPSQGTYASLLNRFT